MSVNVVVNPFDSSVETEVSNSNFRPSLYVVAPGSYAGANYSPSAVSTGSYDTVTLRSSTNSRLASICDIRTQDTEVDFNLNIAINTAVASPISPITSSELRITVLPLLPNEPNRYMNRLCPADNAHMNPKFLEAELVILNTSTNIVSSVTPIAARLLSNNVLALVDTSDAALPFSALTFSAPNTAAIFAIRGNYRRY